MRPLTSLCCGAIITPEGACPECGRENATPENICKHCGFDKGCHNYKTWQCCLTPDAPGVPVWGETRFEALENETIKILT